MIFRVSAEAIQNIRKHAQANENRPVHRRHARGGPFENQGRWTGLRPDGRGQTRPFGLIGMRERMELAGGTLHVKSRRG